MTHQLTRCEEHLNNIQIKHDQPNVTSIDARITPNITKGIHLCNGNIALTKCHSY